MCHVSKRSDAGGGVAVVAGAGVGGQCCDDARGGVGDGDDDGGLLDLGPVDALDVERGGDDLLQRTGGFGEQSQRVGKFIDQGQVVVREGRGVFDGLEFGFDRLLLIVAFAELGGEPVADSDADRVRLPGELPDLGRDAVQRGIGLPRRRLQSFGAGGVGLVLLGLSGGDECELGGAVVAER